MELSTITFPLLAVGEILLAAGIFCCTVYLFWLYSNRREDAELLWAGFICLGSSVYAGANVEGYLIAGSVPAYHNLRVAFVGLAIMVWAMVRFCAVATVYAGVWWRRPMDLSLILWTVLSLGTPWMADVGSLTVDLRWHPHPFPIPDALPLTGAFYLWCVITTTSAWVWLVLRLPRRSWADRLLLMVLPLSLFAGVHDAFITASIIPPSPLFLVEYSLALSAFAFFSRTMVGREQRYTASQLAQAAAEASLDRALISAPEAMVLQREEVLLANQAWSALLGNPEDTTLVGRPLIDHLAENDALVFEAALQRLSTDGRVDPLALEINRPDGDRVMIELHLLAIDYRGKPAVLMTARDISETRRLRAKMMTMDRMVAAGTLAAGVAHEINNPLAYVLANLTHCQEVLEADLDIPRGPETLHEKLYFALEDAAEGGQRIKHIVEDLRTIVRDPEGTLELVNVREAIEMSLRLAHNTLKHRATVEARLEVTPPVSLPVGRLTQVLINLLTNAAAAYPEGNADEHLIRVGCREEESLVIVTVEDFGRGISDEVLPRIFDAFFTTKPVGEGTGLGLSICWQIITEAGGTLVVRSEEGKGTLFTLSLPGVLAAG